MRGKRCAHRRVDRYALMPVCAGHVLHPRFFEALTKNKPIFEIIFVQSVKSVMIPRDLRLQNHQNITRFSLTTQRYRKVGRAWTGGASWDKV